MNQILVLYHSNCADGFGAAWAAWKLFGDTADYVPAVYGAEPPDIEQYSTIYVLDFSYPKDVLERWVGNGEFNLGGRTVRVIDHHRTAQEQLKDFPGAIFDMSHSGAYLAWKYFHEPVEVPQLIRYVEDRDMWWWKLPHSREVSAALWSYPMGFHIWNTIAEQIETYQGLRMFADEGAAILRYMKQQTEMICNQAYLSDFFAGLDYDEIPRDFDSIPVVNTTSLWSEVGEELLRLYPEATFVGCYHTTRDGHEKWSLRSKGEFDVSAVARQFGGGGHKNAAGFVI